MDDMSDLDRVLSGDAQIGESGSDESSSFHMPELDEQTKYFTGAGSGRTPLSDIRDVAAGAVTGAYKGGKFLNEEMMKIPGAWKLAGYLHKKLGIKDRPDLEENTDKMIEGLRSPKRTMGGDLLFGAGEYAPYGIAGGASLLGQIPAGAAFGAATTEPGEKNLGGWLPEGRLGGAIEGGATALIPPIAKGAFKAAPKAWNYMHPEKMAEELRSSLGQGTSKENISELGKRMEFAKKSATEEALIPKHEVYSHEGKSDIYKTKESALPEGNIDKLVYMFEKKGRFTPDESKAVSKALSAYRKSGNVDSFIEHVEDSLGIEHISSKDASRIEDVLSIPTERESAYLKDHKAPRFYDQNLKELHAKFEGKPTLNNYDSLQSAMKARERKLSTRYNNGTISGREEIEMNQLRQNIKHLDEDSGKFMQTLPEKLQNLEKEFRTKYAQNVGKYTDAGQGAKNIIRKLYKGKSGEVTPAQINRIFTHPTKEVMDILHDLGPSAGKNILYNALQKVPPGDAEGIAKTILDLKRTKGYDQFVTPELEKQASALLRQIKWSTGIRSALQSVTGAGIGTAVGGPVGGFIGAAIPHSPKLIKLIAEQARHARR